MSLQPGENGLLRILSFGAGAIGTYVAGSLALQEYPVVFLERPEVAAELRQRGLRLKLEQGDYNIPHPHMADSLEQALELGPYDVAIFALKSYDTQAALEGIRPYAARMPPILSLQNGVDNEPRISEVLGDDQVIAGSVTSAIGRYGAGHIQLERLRGMGIGAEHPLSARLVDACNQAGLNARLYRHSKDMKWSKLITNLLANASSAILDLPPAKIFEHPGLYRLELNQLREALKVMSAQDIQAVDLPGTPVRALAFAVRSLPAGISRNLLKNAVGSGRGGKMPSFHIDLYGGRGKSEVEYLNGAVVRQGERLGIATPVNRVLTDTLVALTQGEIPLESFRHRPEKLLALMG